MGLLSCDVCGADIVIQPSGTMGVCTKCGAKYTIERLRGKIYGMGSEMHSVPRSEAQLYELLNRYCDLGEYQEAEKAIKKILEMTPYDEDAWRKYHEIGSLKNMEIKNGVLMTYTGHETKVNIPNCVHTIRQGAFDGTYSIEQLIISDSVKVIEACAFASCTALKRVKLSASIHKIESGVFRWCHSLEYVEIPNSVTEIGPSAFEGCSSLAMIDLPDSVTEIGCSAFENCSSLTRVAIPAAICKIDDKAFYACEKLSTVTFYKHNGQNACIALETGCSIFEGCSSLVQISLPAHLTKIGERMFGGCTAINHFKVPDTIREIGRAAFIGCTALANIEIPTSVREIERDAFCSCIALTKIEIPASVAKIGDGAFHSCQNLIEVAFTERGKGMREPLARIPSQAFKDCRSLVRINIPNTVTTIGNWAFKNCGSLVKIEIPAPIKFIDVGAFSGCTNLEFVEIMGNPELGFAVFDNTKYGNKKRWRKSGLCAYCGGIFTGTLLKRCTKCGRLKNYY